MAKKTFKDSINPAMNFISQESIDKAAGGAIATAGTAKAHPEKAPEGYKFNPLYIETKSKRLQLLIQPSLYERIKSKAKAEGISANELVNRILQGALVEE